MRVFAMALLCGTAATAYGDMGVTDSFAFIPGDCLTVEGSVGIWSRSLSIDYDGECSGAATPAQISAATWTRPENCDCGDADCTRKCQTVQAFSIIGPLASAAAIGAAVAPVPPAVGTGLALGAGLCYLVVFSVFAADLEGNLCSFAGAGSFPSGNASAGTVTSCDDSNDLCGAEGAVYDASWWLFFLAWICSWVGAGLNARDAPGTWTMRLGAAGCLGGATIVMLMPFIPPASLVYTSIDSPDPDIASVMTSGWSFTAAYWGSASNATYLGDRPGCTYEGPCLSLAVWQALQAFLIIGPIASAAATVCILAPVPPRAATALAGIAGLSYSICIIGRATADGGARGEVEAFWIAAAVLAWVRFGLSLCGAPGAEQRTLPGLSATVSARCLGCSAGASVCCAGCLDVLVGDAVCMCCSTQNTGGDDDDKLIDNLADDDGTFGGRPANDGSTGMVYPAESMASTASTMTNDRVFAAFGNDAVKAAVKVASAVTSLVPIAGPLLAQLFFVVERLATAAAEAKTNRSQCEQLAQRINRHMQMLRKKSPAELGQLEDKETFSHYVQTVESSADLCRQFSETGWMRRMMQMASDIAKFNAIKMCIDEAIQDLQLEVQVDLAAATANWLRAQKADETTAAEEQIRVRQGQDDADLAEPEERELRKAIGNREDLRREANGAQLEPWELYPDEVEKTMARDKRGVLVYVKPLGKGACGVVYRGKFRGLDVAIKVLELNGDSAMRGCRAEIETMSRLNHPNIIKFHGASLSADGEAQLVMALGKCTLSDVLYRAATRKEVGVELDTGTKYRLAIEIATGMAYLHASNIVHRDLKPQNVLVSGPQNRARINDSGMAKTKGSCLAGTVYVDAGGTLVYTAPEVQAQGDRRGKRSVDVYSYAVTVNEMFAETHPFDGVDGNIAMLVVLNNRRPELASQLPPRLREVALKGWSAAPRERPAFHSIQTQLLWEREAARGSSKEAGQEDWATYTALAWQSIALKMAQDSPAPPTVTPKATSAWWRSSSPPSVQASVPARLTADGTNGSGGNSYDERGYGSVGVN